MIYAQTAKYDLVFHPLSIASNATSSGTVDTLGYDFATFIWNMATVANTSHYPTTMKLEESDDLTTYAALVPFTGGTATSTSVGFVHPALDSSNSTIWVWNMDLKGHKRYIKATFTPATTMICGCTCQLTRGDVMPDTTTEAGVHQWVNG
jgi:hypothetical protein